MGITKYRRNSFLTAVLATMLLLALLVPCSAAAQAADSGKASGGAIAQGFRIDTNTTIVPRSLVSAKANTPRSVELATTDSASRLLGVVSQDPIVSISTDTNEVQVVLSGTTNVLVSDINGDIHTGDKITASPIEGVGMRATAVSQVVGSAQADFDSKQAKAKSVRDRSGKTHIVQVGQVPIQINVAYYQPPGSNILPPFAQSLADSIAGHSVSLVKVLLCGAILLAGLIGFITLIVTSVRSAMISIGRNPLAADSLHSGLLQMGVIAISLLVVCFTVSYLVLKL